MGNFQVVIEHRFIPTPFQSLSRDGCTQYRTLSDRPASFTGATPCVCRTLVNSELNQVLAFAFRLFPVVPNAVAQPISQPSIQVPQLAICCKNRSVVVGIPNSRVLPLPLGISTPLIGCGR